MMSETDSAASKMRFLRAGIVVLLAALALMPRLSAQGLPYALFERYLESLREQTAIPGLSAVIVQGRRVVWEAGLGKQDVEANVAARPDTPYLIGGLTQSFGAVVLGQCVERTGLSIDAQVRRWTSSIPESSATIRHVMAHASSGAPGEAFSYDPFRYATLTSVAEDCATRPFRRTVAEDIFDRLGMSDSLPGRDLQRMASSSGFFDDARLRRYEGVLQRLAIPYRVDRTGKATRVDYPSDSVSTADGLVSTARDLARFDMAVDDDVLIAGALRAAAWTNVTTSSGARLPTGLGWLVQTYNSERLVWHFGAVRDSASSLVLKVPSRDITLILLANSDGLSAPYTLTDGDVTASLFAKLFLRLFVS
jgi:CubicO group peptidase (beta-lactamase class C family)